MSVTVFSWEYDMSVYVCGVFQATILSEGSTALPGGSYVDPFRL